MDRNTSAVGYIDHLQPGEGDDLLLPHYCREDKPKSVIPNELCVLIDDAMSRLEWWVAVEWVIAVRVIE